MRGFFIYRGPTDRTLQPEGLRLTKRASVLDGGAKRRRVVDPKIALRRFESTLSGAPLFTPTIQRLSVNSLEHCLGSARCNHTIPCIGNCTFDRCGVHQDLVANVRTVSSWCRTHVGRALSSLYMLKWLQICITAKRAIGTVSACRLL